MRVLHLLLATALPLPGVTANVDPSNIVEASSVHAAILSGSNNKILNTAKEAVIGGGESNIASGNHAGILGGYSNFATANFGAVLGGYANNADGRFGVVLGGSTNTAARRLSLAAGFKARAIAENSAAFGFSTSGTSCEASEPGTFKVCADRVQLDLGSTPGMLDVAGDLAVSGDILFAGQTLAEYVNATVQAADILVAGQTLAEYVDAAVQAAVAAALVPKYNQVPLPDSGKWDRVVALSFENGATELSTDSTSPGVTQQGSLTIMKSGGVGDSAYLTGFNIRCAGSGHTCDGSFCTNCGTYHVGSSHTSENPAATDFLFFENAAWWSAGSSQEKRTFIAWYRGTQMNMAGNSDAYSCGVPIFGDPTNAVYMGLGLDGGKIAICNGNGGNGEGTATLADGTWHMLAWVAAPEGGGGADCIQMFDDSQGLMVKTGAPVCDFNCHVGDTYCSNAFIGAGYPYGDSVAPTALDEIQVYHNAGLTAAELNEIYVKSQE